MYGLGDQQRFLRILPKVWRALFEKEPIHQWDQAGKPLFEDINAWNALSRIFTDILKDPTLQKIT
jgi:hypothetical protein